MCVCRSDLAQRLNPITLPQLEICFWSKSSTCSCLKSSTELLSRFSFVFLSTITKPLVIGVVLQVSYSTPFDAGGLGASEGEGCDQ